MKDRNDLEIVNWSDSLSWLYQTSKELSLLTKECLRDQQQRETLQLLVLQAATSTIYKEKEAQWADNLPRATLTAIVEILKDYEQIFSRESVEFSGLLKREFLSFKQAVHSRVQEMAVAQLVRVTEEFLALVTASNLRFVAAKCEHEFKALLALLGRLETADESILKAMKPSAESRSAEFCYFLWRVVEGGEGKTMRLLQEQSSVAYRATLIELLRWGVRQVGDLERLLEEPFNMKEGELKEAGVLRGENENEKENER